MGTVSLEFAAAWLPCGRLINDVMVRQGEDLCVAVRRHMNLSLDGWEGDVTSSIAGHVRIDGVDHYALFIEWHSDGVAGVRLLPSA